MELVLNVTQDVQDVVVIMVLHVPLVKMNFSMILVPVLVLHVKVPV